MQVRKLAAQYEAGLNTCHAQPRPVEPDAGLSRDSVTSGIIVIPSDTPPLALPGKVSLLTKRIEAAISTESSLQQPSPPSSTRLPLSLAASTVSSSTSVSPPSPPPPRSPLLTLGLSSLCDPPQSPPAISSPVPFSSPAANVLNGGRDDGHHDFDNDSTNLSHTHHNNDFDSECDNNDNDSDDDDDSVTPITVDTVFWRENPIGDWDEDIDDAASSVVRVDDAFSLDGLDLADVDAVLEADLTPSGVHFSLKLSRSQLNVALNECKEGNLNTASGPPSPELLASQPTPQSALKVPPACVAPAASPAPSPAYTMAQAPRTFEDEDLSTLRRGGQSWGPGARSSSSARRLPKAKVMLGRRRPHTSDAVDFNGPSKCMSADGVLEGHDSLPTPGRRLVREYSHPRELFEGHVSMVVPIGAEEDRQHRYSNRTDSHSNAEARKFARARQEDAMKHRMRMEVGRNSADYDAFTCGLGANKAGLSSNRGRGRLEQEDFLDTLGMSGSSKKRYSKRQGVFVGAGGVNTGNNGNGPGKGRRTTSEDERRKRIADRMERTGLMISGTLDRVSMAADPWIDFITAGTGTPDTTERRPGRRGRIRRAIFRLFGVCNSNTRLLRQENVATQ